MHIGAIVAVSDLARSRAFYEKQLGLAGGPSPGGWRLEADEGTVIYLLPGIDEAGSASWPVASILVADVHEAVSALRGRGVPFLGMDDLPFDLDADGVSVTDEMSVAWLRDPDGSILTVFERH